MARQNEVERVLLEADLRDKERELEKAEALRKAHTELEKTHRELQETQGKLVQSEKIASLGMLVAGIAHEINTPVGAASSMHQTLVKAADRLRQSVDADASIDPETRRAMQKSLAVIDDANRVIRSGNERVVDIVKRLRSFARLDEAELKRVDIHQGIDDTLSLLHGEIKDRVRVTRRYGELPEIACFPAQLNQAFLNLLVNAKQAIMDPAGGPASPAGGSASPAGGSASPASPTTGEITITTSRVDDQVLIDIADSGVGIPEENLPRIFDPGFTTKGVGVGTGLGLSICYQIIRSHRGDIRVVSEVERGTTVSVVLPTDLDAQLGRPEREPMPAKKPPSWAGRD
jgi:signal transduction histidine kinase